MYASTQASDAKRHRQKRSRLIKEMAADLNRNEDSIASSTGSAHGTVSTDPTYTESIRQEESMHELRPSPSITPPPVEYMDDSDSFGFHPGRDGAINSTGQWDISYTDMKRIAREQHHKERSGKEKAKLPELRATAKKYGRWSPKPAQVSYVIDVSAIDKAFPDFSGGIDSADDEDDLSREFGRSVNSRPAKHISIDVPIYCDTTGHSDSRPLTSTGGQGTLNSVADIARVDTANSIPLQDLSLNDLKQQPHYAESVFSVDPPTRSTNIKAATNIHTKHQTSKSRDAVEIERSQSPFDHFGKTGNKENIVPKSGTLPKANTKKPALRTTSNPRFQARVRDELDSSRLISEEVRETQEFTHDISLVSARSQNAQFISLRSAVNSTHEPRTTKNHKAVVSMETKSEKRKQTATANQLNNNTRETSATSNGTVVHNHSLHPRNNWYTAAKVPEATIEEEQSFFNVQSNTQDLDTRPTKTNLVNPTVMSFVAPSNSASVQHATGRLNLGLPTVRNGRVQRIGTPTGLNRSFGNIDGLELPEDEEDIYQMCQSQQLRIQVLEEERKVQDQRIRLFEEEMAMMKRQLAEFESASAQKWKDHQCIDSRLQDQFNHLQASFAQVKHEKSVIAQENEELRVAKRDLDNHRCVDTELELENAQLRADNERLEKRLQKWEGHKCVDSNAASENQQLKQNLEKFQSHVCRDKKLEREVRYLKDLRGGGGGSDVHLHITLKDARCRKRKD